MRYHMKKERKIYLNFDGRSLQAGVALVVVLLRGNEYKINRTTLFLHARHLQSAQNEHVQHNDIARTFVLALSCCDGGDDEERQTYQFDKPNSFFSHIRFVSTSFFFFFLPRRVFASLLLRPLSFKLVNELRYYTNTR